MDAPALRPGLAPGRLTAEDYAKNFADAHPRLTPHEALVAAEFVLEGVAVAVGVAQALEHPDDDVRAGSDDLAEHLGIDAGLGSGREVFERILQLIDPRRPVLDLDETVTIDGERHYRIHAHLNDSQFRENAVLNLTVTSDGLVRELTFRRIVTLRNTQRLTTHVRVSRVGETTVERPDWYETARNATASG